MINNDDPLPIKRLGEQARKVNNYRSLFTRVRMQVGRNISILTLFTMISIGVHVNITSGAYTTSEHVVTVESQQYESCLFRKELHASTVIVSASVDEECITHNNVDTSSVLRAKHLREVLTGHPMEQMAEFIALEDPIVAAFIVGIGKQESNWGKRSPWKAGQDCYNYWGYKTSGSRGQALGHACFGSPEEAVATIAKRIGHFVHDQGRTTPEQLLVWKCGYTCASHDPAGVARWVATVRTYSQKTFMPEKYSGNENILSRK